MGWHLPSLRRLNRASTTLRSPVYWIAIIIGLVYVLDSGYCLSPAGVYVIQLVIFDQVCVCVRAYAC